MKKIIVHTEYSNVTPEFVEGYLNRPWPDGVAQTIKELRDGAKTATFSGSGEGEMLITTKYTIEDLEVN